MTHRDNRPFANPYEQFTPLDNLVFDQIMPRLSPNGWKILCVAIRQTWGYHDPTSPTGRKQSDQISYSQFMEKTGIGSKSTVSSAITENLEAGYLLRRQCGTDPRSGLPLYEYALNTEYELGGTESGPQASGTESGPLAPVSGTENGPHSGTETVPTKESKQRTTKERAPGGAGAIAPDAAASHLVRQEQRYMGTLIVVHYPEDLTFYCPSCDEQQAWPTKRTNFACVKCKEPLAGFELGNYPSGRPDWKPLKKPIEGRERQILGSLFKDCPEQLRYYPYFARDRTDLVKVHAVHPALLWGEIQFQAVKNVKGECPRQQVAHNGMVAAQHKLPVALRPKEANETQAERDARTARPVSAELDGIWEQLQAESRAEGTAP